MSYLIRMLPISEWKVKGCELGKGKDRKHAPPSSQWAVNMLLSMDLE